MQSEAQSQAQSQAQSEAQSLDRLLGTMGPALLDVLVAPRGLDVVLTRTELVDAADEVAFGPGVVLLLVTEEPSGPSATAIVRSAGTTGAAAVVVKRHGRDLAPLVTSAERSGVAVLVAADEVSWRHLDGLMSSTLEPAPGEMFPGVTPGDELFAVANAVAAAVGGSVAIEDLAHHVLAYSTVPGQRIDELRRRGILDRQVPAGPDDPDQYRKVLASNGVVRFPGSGDELPRMATAIRAGSMAIGTLWAIEGALPPDAVAERSVADGARLAALALLRRHSSDDLERLQRAELLRGLLDGRLTPATAWLRLGLPASDRSVLLGVTVSWTDQPAALLSEIDRHARRACLAVLPRGVVTVTDRAVYVLATGKEPDRSALRFAEHLLALLGGADIGEVHVAMAALAGSPADLRSRRAEVDQILAMATTFGGMPRIVRLADVRSHILLTHFSELLGEHPELAHPGITRLVELDAENQTDMAASVLAWIQANGDYRAAAEVMSVHPNTIRYRLRRVEKLTGVHLDDPNDRLVVWLQLLGGVTPSRRLSPAWARRPPHAPETREPAGRIV